MTRHIVLSILVLLVVLTNTVGATSELVCAIRDTDNTFAGINVTKICVWDIVNTSTVSSQFYNASIIDVPLNQIERNLIPGTKAHYTVTTTATTNQTLFNFVNALAVYDKDKELDLVIKLESNGLPIVFKLNNTEIENYISNYPDSIKGTTFENLMRMVDYGYAFNNTGWANVSFNATTKKFDVKENCTGFNLGKNITETIRMNSISLQNFRLNNSSINCGLPQELRTLKPGYYALAVIGVNELGNPILKLLTPFIVLNGTASSNKPSVSDVVSGKDLSISFGYEFNASFAILVKNVTYNASLKMDLTKEISKSFYVNLTHESEPLTEVKILDKSVNFYAPEKLVRAVFNNSENYQNINTQGLETGEYFLYLVTFGDNLEPKYIGKLTVNILPPKATLIINSIPSGADVYVNDTLRGKTNLTLELDPGTYSIKITKSGYQDYTTTVTLSAGETKTIEVSLNPVPTTAPRPPVGGGGGGGGGVIPGVPIYMSDYIKVRANQETEFILPQSAFWETNIFSVTFLTSEDITLRIRIEKLKEWPSIPRPVGIVAFIFTVDLTLSAPAEVKGQIVYGVERDLIRENLFDPDNVLVTLYRFDGENWIKCDTSFVGSDGKYNYYKAKVPAFSYFAAVIEAMPPTTTPVETPEKTPPVVETTPPPPISFEMYLAIFIVLAIGAILAMIAYMLWRTK